MCELARSGSSVAAETRAAPIARHMADKLRPHGPSRRAQHGAAKFLPATFFLVLVNQTPTSSAVRSDSWNKTSSPTPFFVSRAAEDPTDLERCIRHPKLCELPPSDALQRQLQSWSASNRTGLVIWECAAHKPFLCGGNGDRLRGLAAAFKSAVRLRARFRVVWTRPTSIWDIFDERRREYFEHTEPPASVPQKLVKAIDRAYNISSWRETLQRNGVIRLHTNIAPSDAPMSADEIGDLIRALFAPSAALLKELSASAHGCKVCLHIRTGDQAMRVGKTLRSNEAQQHAMVAEACELAGCRDGRSARICLATDSQDLKRRLISQWKGNIVARNGSVAHTDRSIWRHGQTTSPGAMTKRDHLEAWAEQLMLGSCPWLVHSRSGFSESARVIGNLRLIQ